MATAVHIRPARPADGDAIVALILPIQQQEFGIAVDSRFYAWRPGGSA